MVQSQSSETADGIHRQPKENAVAPLREEFSTVISPLTQIEQKQLVAWNSTHQDYPRDACVPHLIAKQASIVPDAVALVAGDQTLTYRELNQRANQLAHYLQTLGVGQGVLVGLCIERSFDMVVGLLGILKAGGAYVPLDPSYPTERLAFMLEDARAPILITQQYLAGRLPTFGNRIVCLDTESDQLSQQSKNEPCCAATLDDLAYVVYTSGSTGQPKGAQIVHDSLLNLVFWHLRAFGVTDADRATQVAAPAFDATVWELWPYLTIGASIYLLDEETRISPALLRDWLLRRGITITFLPTALAELIIALKWPSTTSLRFLLTGADMLHHFPPPTLPFALINNYGLSEATVVSTSGCVAPAKQTKGPPSIGRPIANTETYILDEHLQQVPIGSVGELHVGGKGLARGYLNRPGLTAEKFIPHPFSVEPSARLYKTGDLARYLPDGQIALMGRIDHQVKIRGYRIEPDEIASVLNRHPSIRTSLVLSREDVPGNKRLVAYIVPVPGAYITTRSLQDALMIHLPEYMVPSIFVLLESLPLTPNGKVDLAALPAPDTSNTVRDSVKARPQSPTEERLVRIVAPLLALEQVGLDDNFFLLGGTSMMGTQLITRVAETFGIDLPLRTLFEMPTVRQLAARIEHLVVAKIEAMSEDDVLRLLQ